MAKDNLLSIVVPPEVITAVTDAINVITTQLKPYLVALKSEERKKLPKMGDKTMPFVSKVIEYAGTNPEFIPPFMNLTELRNDFTAVTVLTQMFHPLSGTVSNLNDTILVEGSDSYKESLKYYDSVKISAKNDVPSAKTIYEDLRKRFEPQKKNSGEEETTTE